ncbi:MAG: polysaccharide deacetylase family protein [Desulfobulbaceae bacterium]|nr:polysaccharide deacetylase family protein [Desulfobulbaceae bacterium]
MPNKLTIRILFPYLTIVLLCTFLVALSSCTRSNDRHTDDHKIVVLAYHQINDDLTNTYTVTPQTFVEQVSSLLRRGYVSINSNDYYAWQTGKQTLPSKCFLLTFDDGSESDYTIVYPLLKKMNLRATFFPVISHIDDPGRISTKQLQEMSRDERYSFGSHTVNHKVLPLLETEELRRELVDSRLFLEKITGKNTISLSYPFGAWIQSTIPIAQEAGYKMAFTIIGGVNGVSSDLFTLRRIAAVNSLQEQDWIRITDFDPETYHDYYSSLLKQSIAAGHTDIATICRNELKKLGN